MKRFIVVALVLILVFTFAACTSPGSTPSTAPEESAEATEAPAAPSESAEATEAPAEPEETAAPESSAEGWTNPNAADYTDLGPEDEVFDINTYYNEKDPELACDVTITLPGQVAVPDDTTTEIPKANGDFTVGFSVYYTVDEVGAMILETMETTAAEAGIELLVNDANYEQNLQDQAIDQWILQDVDGVILAPCNFTGVKESLDKLVAAGIPVVTLNAPLAGTTDSIVMSDCVQQGEMAGQMLIDALEEAGTPIEGKIVYQSLPFVHPNAATRTIGFKNAFADYPDIEFIELTGTSPEEHYTAFEGALQANPDMIGAWGLYSSATIGMVNAKLAAGSDIPISSVDNDKIILAGIKEGNIVGSACYSSIAPAWWCMSQMVNMLNGETVPGVVYYENMAATADNVDELFEHYYPGQTLAEYMETEE